MFNNRRILLITIGLACLVLCTVFLSYLLLSDFGHVRIESFRLTTAEGYSLTGKLFIPKTADADNPAPAILLCHGGNNEYSVMEPLASQLSSKGYVAIVFDAYKHGGSSIHDDESMGVEDMLKYMHSLDFIDQAKIGAIGHTLGGAYLFNALKKHPDWVKSVICMDYITIGGSLEGIEPQTPMNIGWILAMYDEHQKNTLEPLSNATLLQVFDTAPPIKPNMYYGSVGQNNIRMIQIVPVFSSALVFSQQAANHIIDFFNTTIGGVRENVQTHRMGLLLLTKFISLVLFLTFICFSIYLIGMNISTMSPALGKPDRRLSIFAMFAPLVTTITFVPLYMVGKRILSPTIIFPQTDTNGLAIWAVFTGCIWLLLSASVSTQNRQIGIFQSLQGILSGSKDDIFHTMKTVMLVAISAYGLDLFIFWLTGERIGFLYTNFSFFTPRKLLAFFIYLPIFLIYFLGCSVFCAKFLYRGKAVIGKYLYFHSMGFILILALFFLGFPLKGEVLFYNSRFAIIPIAYMLFLLPFFGITDYLCYRKTGLAYRGALMNAFVFTWLFVATNAMYLLIT